MMRQMRGVMGGCVLLVLTLAVAGCATPLAGEQMPGENVVYVRGGTQGQVSAEPAQVIEAAESVMAKMQMAIREPQIEEGEVEVHSLGGRTASGQRVNITATPVEAGGTLLRVRLGTFGDQQLSNELYRRIASRLQ